MFFSCLLQTGDRYFLDNFFRLNLLSGISPKIYAVLQKNFFQQILLYLRQKVL